MKILLLLALAFVLGLGGSAALAHHEGDDFWLHCVGSPASCDEQPVPTVTVTVTETVAPEPPPPPPPPPTTSAPAPDPARSVILDGAGWTCRAAVDLDLVRVSNPPGDAVVFAAGCTGRIGRLEVETRTADGIKVQNAGTVARDILVESGAIVCVAAAAGVHQDGVQVMGGARITLRNLSVDCPFSNSHYFVARGGSGASTPTDVVCEGCYFGPRAASHTVLLGTSLRSGMRNSTLCPDRTGGDPVSLSGASSPIDENNARPAGCG
jgi:hypothetical protein